MRYTNHIMDTSGKVALTLLSLMVLVAILATGWLFFIKRDYDFVVEASCNPEMETCFYRDCSVEGDCPPNELEHYKVYVVNAADFRYCSDNSCAAECSSDSITCEQVVCGEAEEDECSEPASSSEEPEETVPE